MPSSFCARAISLGFLPAALFIACPARSQTYSFTVFAGSPDGRSYVDGVGSAARFYSPVGIAVDARGTVYVTDGFDTYAGDGEAPGSLIRRISPEGVVTTLAGSSTSVGLVDGVGSAARFRSPAGVAVDASGNLFIADTWNDRIRKVTPDGIVSTLDSLDDRRSGWPAFGVAVDANGNIFHTVGQKIRKLTVDGVVTTFAGSDALGSGDGPASAARFTSPCGVAVDASGNLFVVEYHNHTLRKITPAGVVTTLAGMAGVGGSADGMGSAARFRWPGGVAVDGHGSVFVADSNGVRKLTADGFVTTLRGSTGIGPVVAIAVNGSGEIYVIDNNRTIFKGVLFEGVPPAIATQPQSQTAGRGRVAVFNVTASGSPAPSYQWNKNGTALPGATEATLLFTNVTTASAGSYQCIVANAGGSVASDAAALTIVETMDTGRFSNFSVRAAVGAGRSIVAGFVVESPAQKTVLVRGIGPGLASFGIAGVLSDPALAVISNAGERLAENDNWPSVIASVFPAIGAFALPAGSKDAAVLLPLQPGSYTVLLSSADAGAGEALIEIYELP